MKKLSWCRVPAAQKKGSCSDKRKKENGVVAGESEVRRDSSERQTLQTPAAASSLSAAAASAAGCWRRGRRCSLVWPDSGVQGTAGVGLHLIKEPEQGFRLKGVFLFDFRFVSQSDVIPLRDVQEANRTVEGFTWQ